MNITVKVSKGDNDVRELDIVVGSYVFYNDEKTGKNEFKEWETIPEEMQCKYAELASRYSLDGALEGLL